MISSAALRGILADWSFWDKEPPDTHVRMVNLPKSLHTDLVLIIQGVRRSGKSTLLTQLPKRYGLPLSQCTYCNFEDPRLLGDLNYRVLSQIVTEARKGHSADVPCYFFFDEIQNVEHWEKWLHTQLERPGKNYFVLTGSNSCLLGGEFATALTGRHLTLELFPFSYAEYHSLFPKRELKDYLLSGGFPKPLSFDAPKKLLQEYFNDIILRDVLKRVHSRHPESIQQVAQMVFESCGSEVSFRKIAAVTGLTVDTVKSYLMACEQAYLLFQCPYFAYSEKKRALRNKKYYPIDSGLRHAVVSVTGSDLGKSLELLVFITLKKSYQQVYFWSEIHKGEVDFVVRDGKSIIPYQVTLIKPEARHEIALDHFFKAFPDASDPKIITLDNAHEYL